MKNLTNKKRLRQRKGGNSIASGVFLMLISKILYNDLNNDNGIIKTVFKKIYILFNKNNKLQLSNFDKRNKNQIFEEEEIENCYIDRR